MKKAIKLVLGLAMLLVIIGCNNDRPGISENGRGSNDTTNIVIPNQDNDFIDMLENLGFEVIFWLSLDFSWIYFDREGNCYNFDIMNRTYTLRTSCPTATAPNDDTYGVTLFIANNEKGITFLLSFIESPEDENVMLSGLIISSFSIWVHYYEYLYSYTITESIFFDEPMILITISYAAATNFDSFWSCFVGYGCDDYQMDISKQARVNLDLLLELLEKNEEQIYRELYDFFVNQARYFVKDFLDGIIR